MVELKMSRMNPDLSNERKKGTFKPDDVTAQLYGKQGMVYRRLARKTQPTSHPLN